MQRVGGAAGSLQDRANRPIPCTEMTLGSLTMILLNQKSSISMNRQWRMRSSMSWTIVLITRQMRYRETREGSSMAGDQDQNPIQGTILGQDQMEGQGTESKTRKKKRSKELTREEPQLRMLRKCSRVMSSEIMICLRAERKENSTRSHNLMKNSSKTSLKNHSL